MEPNEPSYESLKKQVAELREQLERETALRKQSEDAENDSDNLFKAMIEIGMDVIFILSKDGTVIHASSSVERVLGYELEEIVGKRIFDFVKPEDTRAVAKALKQCNRNPDTPLTIEYRCRHKDDSWRIIESTIINLTDNPLINGIIVNSRDVTERRRSEEKSRDSEERYRTLFGGIGDGILLHDTNGAIVDANDVTCNRLGYAHDELVGMNVGNIVTPVAASQVKKRITEVCRKGETLFETTYVSKDGREICCEVNERVLNIKGTLTIQSVARDIFERKRAEAEKESLQQQLLQSQKMEAIGQLAGGIAHDFNNMLTVIMGNTQLALGQMKPSSSSYRDLKEVLKAATRARDLTMKLLTYARKEKVAPINISINTVIDNMVCIFKRSTLKKIEINILLQDNLPPVNVDVNQIEQALLNVCNNARDAMLEEGVLTIKTANILADEKYCKSHPGAKPGKWCLIEIGDTGYGMSEAVQRKMFDPFFTTKGRGEATGLGLSITHGVIKSHDGCISVKSVEDEGTVFSIYLPFSEDKETRYVVAAGSAKVEIGHETILIVDDEKDLLKLAVKILKKAGYKTLTADSGRKGIRTYKKHREEICLVLLDMIMPNMDGGDVYWALKDLNPDIKVVLSSGYSLDEQVSELLSEGVRGFVQKPFTVAELCNTIRLALDEV